MAWTLEGTDLVISGFEQGIADTPYSGIADMRNIEIISMPGEASVQFAQTAATAPPAFNAVAYTAQNAGDTITLASVTGLYVGCAVVLASNTAGGLSNSIVYYVINIVGNTFQLSVAPLGSAVVISSDGTGTLTTYQYGNQRSNNARAPISYYNDKSGGIAGVNSTLLVDGSNYLWALFADTVGGVLPSNSLIFLGNIGGIGASSITSTGVTIWNSYILLFGSVITGIDYARAGTLLTSGPAAIWNYNWENVGTGSVNGRISTLISQEDGNLYWTSSDGLGSLIETPGDTFDPTDTTTYTINDAALVLPTTDESTCIAELGSNLLVGGRKNFVYVWDKIQVGFSSLLNLPDIFTTCIVAASNNAYIFSGNRGRIYLTNGSGIDIYKKIPDYLTGVISPVIRWQDANFYRNQLIFSFTATSNAVATLNTVSGCWAIDLDTDALRMQNKTTNTGYTGTTAMVVDRSPSSPSNIVATGVAGTATVVGWYSGTTYTVDIGTTSPYTNYESYLHTEIIPVGTFLDPFTPSQIEFKLSAALVSGEGIKISYRTNITESFTLISETTTVGAISDYYKANFEKVQWVQFLVETKSTASSPSYTRLTEMRIRDWPSGKNAGKQQTSK